MSGIIWIIIVGFIAGIIARLLSPGPHNPSGFIFTTILGIVGAFLATWVGQASGHCIGELEHIGIGRPGKAFKANQLIFFNQLNFKSLNSC